MSDLHCEQGGPWDRPGWRARAGKVLLDPCDPQGSPLPTPLDRRWLWKIESVLSVGATTDMQRELARDLGDYLRESCDHHFTGDCLPDGPDDPIGPHRQCLWCSHVDWLTEECW